MLTRSTNVKKKKRKPNVFDKYIKLHVEQMKEKNKIKLDASKQKELPKVVY